MAGTGLPSWHDISRWSAFRSRHSRTRPPRRNPRLDCTFCYILVLRKLRFSQFPIFFLFWGVIFQNVFSQKAAGPAAPRGKSEDPFGGPRTAWWWRDFPRMSKIMKNAAFIILWDQIRRTRGPKSCAPFVRSFLSCQNPLNCHMTQNASIRIHRNPSESTEILCKKGFHY